MDGRYLDVVKPELEGTSRAVPHCLKTISSPLCSIRAMPTTDFSSAATELDEKAPTKV